MAGVYSDSDDEYDDGGDYETSYSDSNMESGGYLDDEDDVDYALGDYGTTHTESNMERGGYSDDEDNVGYALGDYGTTHPSEEHSDDEDDVDYALGDYGTNHPVSNTKSEEHSDDEDNVDYALGDYGTTHSESITKSEGQSGEQHYALGDYGTSYSKSITQSGGSQVNVYQQTYRAKDEDKLSGSYERLTVKDKAVCGEPFVDRSGNRGYKDEHTKSATYKVGDKSGYTEYFREERVKHVDFDKSSSSNNNKAVGHYPKYNKY